MVPWRIYVYSSSGISGLGNEAIIVLIPHHDTIECFRWIYRIINIGVNKLIGTAAEMPFLVPKSAD